MKRNEKKWSTGTGNGAVVAGINREETGFCDKDSI